MQFERLRKSHKKQIVVGTLVICVIGGALTFSLTRAKYKIANDLDLAKGTINYKAYDFKIMAIYKSDDKTNYTEIEEMPSEGYNINESKSYCNMSNGNKDTTAILKTIDGNHIVSKLKKNDRCYLYFDKYLPPIAVDDIITSTNYKTTIPTTFTSGATTDEGVYSVDDPVYNGTSYYWRGLVTSNYVKFAGFCWRIVRINGDKTMRLIYDGTTCHANGSNADSIAKTGITYNTSCDQPYYVGWTYGTSQRPSPTTGGTNSNAKTQLQSWYYDNLKIYESKLADGIYCNDRDTESGTSYGSSIFYYAARKRIFIDHSPSLACNTKDRYKLKVGLLTIDEVMYAGGSDVNNNKYYLYNNRDYWTMSPSFWNGNGVYACYVNVNGYLTSGYVNYTSPGLRPVINLKSDTQFQSGGDGTLNNPYVVAD